MVPVAGCSFPRSTVHNPTKETSRWMEPYERTCQKPCILVLSPNYARSGIRDTHGKLVAEMGSYVTRWKSSSHNKDSTIPGILTPVRAEKLWPNTNWPVVWMNLKVTPGPETLKAQWYKVIHDLIPTNERLHKIHLSPTDQCRLCNQTDTLSHRLKDCGEGPRMWHWTRQRIAAILRIDERYTTVEWLLRPYFHLRPTKRHRAVLWILVHLVVYRTKQDRLLTMNDWISCGARNGNSITWPTGLLLWAITSRLYICVYRFTGVFILSLAATCFGHFIWPSSGYLRDCVFYPIYIITIYIYIYLYYNYNSYERSLIVFCVYI
jgi:hypothetical protein